LFAKQFTRRMWRHLWLILGGLLLCSCSSKKESRIPAARTSMTPAQAEREIYGRVNAYRRSRGLSVQLLDRRISEVARKHSLWMAARKKLSHRGAGGRFTELQRDPTLLVAFAENVALNFGHGNPAQVAVDGWILSPGHYKNMTRRDDRLTGIGVVVGEDGTWYFTQLFGHRRGVPGSNPP
jgi:uncharacterized protein YkwD